MKAFPRSSWRWVSIGMALATVSCARRIAVTPSTPAVPPADHSYVDLEPGKALTVLVPLLKSGKYTVETGPAPLKGGETYVLSAADLTGWEISYYSIEAQAHGRVRLRFQSAEMTKEGKTTTAAFAPRLPFALPKRSRYIRLIFKISRSESDHNMVIASSTSLLALDAFTRQFKADPAVCKERAEVACSWVPKGIAVRSE